MAWPLQNVSMKKAKQNLRITKQTPNIPNAKGKQEYVVPIL